MSDSIWSIYLIRTAAGSLYTGITTDVLRRLAQHQAGKGAKALRGKGELTLVFHCVAGERSIALKLEYRLKQLTKMQKERLVHDQPSSVADLLQPKTATKVITD
ncbi:GIY-YIG nuclease family protein [Yersinia ruckeri]|nr:GIY-YIG nuclease family protein [Yersinia ruckeri]AKA39069.1 GIY-YIG nuclease [Yersinia ruckeri]ARZ02442.1 GIY-YIG nuclease superfamily protein [Yersinia ruckeri]EKN4183003.1 GIY-YIG nuclease family protein [Yersinia ruckeri]EKN4197396.1 GIY-YIG nuclease family protein [Yersinia ruckeri]EKN4204569.1 GIY-YIG nuclease family protein [Yersinia ruckeri]